MKNIIDKKRILAITTLVITTTNAGISLAENERMYPMSFMLAKEVIERVQHGDKIISGYLLGILNGFVSTNMAATRWRQASLFCAPNNFFQNLVTW